MNLSVCELIALLSNVFIYLVALKNGFFVVKRVCLTIKQKDVLKVFTYESRISFVSCRQSCESYLVVLEDLYHVRDKI